MRTLSENPTKSKPRLALERLNARRKGVRWQATHLYNVNDSPCNTFYYQKVLFIISNFHKQWPSNFSFFSFLENKISLKYHSLSPSINISLNVENFLIILSNIYFFKYSKKYSVLKVVISWITLITTFYWIFIKYFRSVMSNINGQFWAVYEVTLPTSDSLKK